MYKDDDYQILMDGLKQMRATCEDQKIKIEILEKDRADLISENDYLKVKVKELADHIKISCNGKCNSDPQLNAIDPRMEDLG